MYHLTKFFLICAIGIYSFVLSQEKYIHGKLSNAHNLEPLSYVKVCLVFPNQEKVFSTTNFDGFYKIPYTTKPDSIVVQQEGFLPKSIFLNENFAKEQHFQLIPVEKTAKQKDIEEVVLKKKKKYKNPAFEILEKLVAKKHLNNPEKLSSYSYENYSRMEISMDNLGEKFKKSRVYKDLKTVMESAKEVSGENGKPILPIFVSENLSDYYYQKNPAKTSEIIKKTKVEGVGIEDGTMFSQLVSSTFIRYNFYNNYIRILGKDFLSPINDNFKMLYDYELVNRDLQIDGKGFYQIDYKPKRASDLAFLGTLYIAHGSYSLERIDAKVTESANLNFINNLRIQQEMTELPENQVSLPSKTRVFVETSRPGKESVGVLLRYYASSRNMKVNEKISEDIFKKAITILPEAEKNDEAYWENHRHDSLTIAEKKMYSMITEVKNLPSVSSYLDIIDLFLNGYYKLGKVGLGPFLYTVGYNDHEGLRLRLGFKTNPKFSDRWILGGYVSYGFKDQKPKYGATVDYIISREPWTQVGISASHDLGQVAFQYEDFAMRKNNIFDSFTKNGKMKLRRPFWQNAYQAYFQTDVLSSLTQKITLKHETFDPLFDFSYARNIRDEIQSFKTSEVIFETKWQPGRKTIETKGNKQLNLKENVYAPIITFRYTHGFKNVFGGDFDYNKYNINVQQVIPMGILGRGEYSLTAGIIPSKVPYPLLENHLGNEFIFYNKYAFNMMRFFEFTSNKYASLQYTQNLEGLITNSLPLIKKWNWRNHFTFNYLIGDLGSEFDLRRNNLRSLNGKPYVELGYGFSNIFRFLRVDFIHRLTHLEDNNASKHPKTPKFSIKLSAQIRL